LVSIPSNSACVPPALILSSHDLTTILSCLCSPQSWQTVQVGIVELSPLALWPDMGPGISAVHGLIRKQTPAAQASGMASNTGPPLNGPGELFAILMT